ncbi:MAG: sigma 54-interacting transcriptional regulator, partial [Spirochaetia bacterium]
LDKTILVVGFKNAVYRCRSVARVLGLKVKELPIPYEREEYNFDNIKYAAERLISKYGIDTIIGDQTAYVNLQSFCESQYLITSSKDDFIEALEKTELTPSLWSTSSNSGHIRSVLDAVNDVVISTNEHGIVTILNRPAEQLFHLKQENAIGCRLEDVVGSQGIFRDLNTSMVDAFNSKAPNFKYLKNKNNLETFLVHANPLTVENETKGVVATIKELSASKPEKPAPHKKTYTGGFQTRYTFDDILTKDAKLLKKIQVAKGYAKTDATVLIEGESGVGKELFAQSIHSAGSRKDKPFVAVNCAAIPAQLLESELFGYVNGAFTGATKGGKMGLFEMAHQGTVFLDEISEIEKSLQVRFLRVLEEKQIMRIGSDKLIDIDVRVISATNLDLKEQVSKGNFRSDLYYRLNLLNLRVPPLREHPKDIQFLANHFIGAFNRKYGMHIDKLTDKVNKQLSEYSWPGNVRELKNVIERVVLTIGHGCIDAPDIELIACEISESIDHEQSQRNGETACGTLEELKIRAAKKALEEENYNKSRAAKRLGIDRSTLDRILHLSI